MKRHLFWIIAAITFSPFSAASTVEVLHFWTSPGERKAVDVLKSSINSQGHTWQDFAVAGGGGVPAKVALRKRVLSGEPPAGAQIIGLNIQRWARLGFLAALEKPHWDQYFATEVSNLMKHRNRYSAIPVNTHRINWMWSNKAILDRFQLAVPTTWDEFEQAAKTLNENGIPVIAQGDQAWQHATLFEAVVLSIAGPTLYRRVFVDHDNTAIRSPEMIQAFQQFRKLLPYMDVPTQAPNWDQASQRLMQGEAAFQFMGDWAKGEFSAHQLSPNVDYYCTPTPGTQSQFIYSIDSLAVFKTDDNNAQAALVESLISPDFQIAFNLNKGSIPARLDLSMAGFDACSQQSRSDFQLASKSGNAVPSIAHHMATTEQIQSQFYGAIQQFVDDPTMTPRQGAKLLSKKIRYGQYLLK